MEPLEGRRLTGRNWLFDQPGAAIDLPVASVAAGQMLAAKARSRLGAVARLLGWPERVRQRAFPGGVTLGCTAPVDQLHSAVEALEWACGVAHQDQPTPAFLLQLCETERNPSLLALVDWAAQQGVPCLVDEEQVALGLGCHSLLFPIVNLPKPAEIDPVPLRQGLPIVYVTGTNGKTTTARVLARIGKIAGFQTGSTSTDGLDLNGVRLEDGDWTGPGGARKVLQNQEVQAAILEAARGGLMRRGLAVSCADVAVVTNVSDDHLGEWGLGDVEAMAEAKLMIRKGLREDGVLVVNAGSAPLLRAVARLGLARRGPTLAWFGQDIEEVTLTQALAAGLRVATLVQHQLAVLQGGEVLLQVPLLEIPMTFAGLALHNVDNALAAALAASYVFPLPAIAQALRTFGTQAADSPGRLNLFKYKGATLVVDFAHNRDGVAHLVTMLGHWPARRKLLLIGQAGDRSDDLLEGLVAAARQWQPDHVMLKDALHYLRGRQPGEIPEILRRLFVAHGQLPGSIEFHSTEAEALGACLDWAEPEDLLLLLIHDDFTSAVAQLHAAGAEAI